ncbi:MAG: TetR/AcrR family transcriptional regulator [Candidatus Methylomirabilales bacterium]
MQRQTVRGTGTKDRVIEAAFQLIHRQGFNNTSLEDILRESGVGKGNFYHYFKSKDDLGYAILDRLALWATDELGRKVFASGEDPVEDIFRLLERIAVVQRNTACVGGCPLGNFALEMSDIHDGFRRRIGEILTSWRDHISEAITRALDRGQLARNVQPQRLAEFIIAGIEGAILSARVHKDPSILDGCFDELKRHVGAYRPE